MTNEEINARLAALGLDRRWFDLGVLSDRPEEAGGAWCPGSRRETSSPVDLLQFALFSYLRHRAAIDDAAFAGLLDIAASTNEALSRKLAAWEHWTAAQLAQIIRHDASMLSVRRLAAQRLRVHALEAAADVAVNLVGFTAPNPHATDAPDGDPTVFEVGHRGHSPWFRFRIAWERPLRADQRRRAGELLAALPNGEEARCHDPVFGLRLDPGTADEVRMSICFGCNNIYLDGGGRRAFEAESDAGGALLAYLLQLAPDAWRRQIRDA